MWIQHPQFDDQLVEWWNINIEGMTLYCLVSKLRHVKEKVREWNKRHFGNIFESKYSIKDGLKIIQDRIQQEPYSMELVKDENEILVESHDILSKEETYWRKCSRSIWLKEGDRKKKNFHLSTLQQRAKNCITSLTKGRVQMTNDQEIFDELVFFFFTFLSLDPDINQSKQADLLDAIPSLVFEEKNKILYAIPKGEEIYKVFFSLQGDKSPGPDDFPMLFFQKEWKLVGKDVYDSIKEFFSAKIMLKETSSTFLCLILKKIATDSLDQFRPISLCNLIYKIISKVLTLRLVNIL